MRRLALALCAAAPAVLLAGCGPAVNAAVGVGYDVNGRLIAAVKVCGHGVHQASLQSDSPEKLLAQWRRDAPLSGTETWALQVGSDGHWTATSSLSHLDPQTEYSLWAEDSDQVQQGHLVFRGSDLSRLQPGQLLALRPQRDAQGSVACRVAVIDLHDMPTEGCSC